MHSFLYRVILEEKETLGMLDPRYSSCLWEFKMVLKTLANANPNELTFYCFNL